MNQQTQFATPQNAFRTPFDDWSGEAVADLSIDMLLEYPEWASSDRLRNTVPEAYRGEARGPKLPCSESNSLAEVRDSFEVLAVDTAGYALTCMTTTFYYEDADCMRYKVMPKDLAFARLSEFRALPAGDNMVDAEAGKSYSGPIVRVTESHAYQQVGIQIVAHDLSMLVGEKIRGYESDSNRVVVEIRYSQSEVGVVTQQVATNQPDDQ